MCMSFFFLLSMFFSFISFFFFFNDTATTEIYTLSLHDALPIYAGYRTLQASDGQDAIEMLRTAQPTLVLLDLGMPNLDGWGFLAMYRKTTGVSLPIVVTSADLPPAATMRLRELGVNRFLTKPIDPALLVIRIEQALAEAALPAGATF